MEGKQSKLEWRKHLAAAESHPGGIRGYCEEKGIGRSRIYYWKKKLVVGPAARAVSPAFVPVTVMNTPKAERLPDPRWLAEFLLAYAGGAQ